MMERLQEFFLGDGLAEVKFRWLVFYEIAVACFVFVPLESFPFAGDPLALRLFGGVPPDPFHFLWMFFGAIGALLAFRRMKGESEERQAQAVTSSQDELRPGSDVSDP